jgi:hypothetical protein
LQLCPAGRVVPHPPLARLKSAPPLIVGFKLIETFPRLRNTATAWLADVPTSVIPKSYETWLRLKFVLFDEPDEPHPTRVKRANAESRVPTTRERFTGNSS